MDFTKEVIADIFKYAGDSVTLINTETSKGEFETEEVWKERIKRNVDHLEIIKGYKDDDGKSIWTTEDFTAIDKAIVDGKKVYGG
tara:strand:- start:236 stop:490 length:255 start_codon:yes stop_codon:yes gene_type:complete